MSVRGYKIWKQEHPQQEYPPDDVLRKHGFETREEAMRRREVLFLRKIKHPRNFEV